MAAKEQKTAEAAKPVEAKPAEPTYTVEELAKYSAQLFGVSSCAYAGATYNLDRDAKYTVAELKAHIKAWGRMEVK